LWTTSCPSRLSRGTSRTLGISQHDGGRGRSRLETESRRDRDDEAGVEVSYTPAGSDAGRWQPRKGRPARLGRAAVAQGPGARAAVSSLVEPVGDVTTTAGRCGRCRRECRGGPRPPHHHWHGGRLCRVLRVTLSRSCLLHHATPKRHGRTGDGRGTDGGRTGDGRETGRTCHGP